MSDYQKLLQKYKELKQDKSDILTLKKELEKCKAKIVKLERINKRLRKDNIEMSCLITELNKRS